MIKRFVLIFRFIVFCMMTSTNSFAQSSSDFSGILPNTASKIVSNGVEYFVAKYESEYFNLRSRVAARRMAQRRATIGAEALLARMVTDSVVRERDFRSDTVTGSFNPDGDRNDEEYIDRHEIEREVISTLKRGVQTVSVVFKEDYVEVIIAIPVYMALN